MTAQIKELKAKCESYETWLHKIKSATNDVTPQERGKVCKERSLYVKSGRSARDWPLI